VTWFLLHSLILFSVHEGSLCFSSCFQRLSFKPLENRCVYTKDHVVPGCVFLTSNLKRHHFLASAGGATVHALCCSLAKTAHPHVTHTHTHTHTVGGRLFWSSRPIFLLRSWRHRVFPRDNLFFFNYSPIKNITCKWIYWGLWEGKEKLIEREREREKWDRREKNQKVEKRGRNTITGKKHQRELRWQEMSRWADTKKNRKKEEEKRNMSVGNNSNLDKELPGKLANFLRWETISSHFVNRLSNLDWMPSLPASAQLHLFIPFWGLAGWRVHFAYLLYLCTVSAH